MLAAFAVQQVPVTVDKQIAELSVKEYKSRKWDEYLIVRKCIEINRTCGNEGKDSSNEKAVAVQI